MKNLVIDIDIENEKIIMYDVIKKIIFENYGIIFGDIVISNILREKYKSIKISDNINIFFNDINDNINLINSLKNKEFILNPYNIDNCCKSFIISYIIGKTFINNGKILEIKCNIYNSSLIDRSEPPFNNSYSTLDFILEDKNGIRFSKNIGTIFDTYNNYKKCIIFNEILNELFNNKIYTIEKNKKFTNNYIINDSSTLFYKKYFIILIK